jgi:hypothetical protein
MTNTLKIWLFCIHQGLFQEKIASYYVAFVGFQYFLAKLGKIKGQETPFLKQPYKGLM